MKKFLNVFVFILVGIICSGCNHYVRIDVSDDEKSTYYGALNRRDMTWADVIAYKKGTETYCDGIAFLDAQKSASTAQVRLACSDGKLINLNWNLDGEKFSGGSATGIDQFNTSYKLYPIKRKEYKNNSPVKKAVIPNSSTNFVLKY